MTFESRTENLTNPMQTFLCLSHLRWNSVYQRPQHLLSRAASYANVLFFEEPVTASDDQVRLESRLTEEGVNVLVPHLPSRCSDVDKEGLQRALLETCLEHTEGSDLLVWYYSPMSVAFTDHLRARTIVYDCMDELTAFKNAPPRLAAMEQRVLALADVVFTGGRSLYEAKRNLHANVYSFPSSVDIKHFSKARAEQPDPLDQEGIGHPRIGFAGVIDERFDIQLVDALAADRPDWQLVFIGPVVKIAQEDLPRRNNIHYLGPKDYKELPRYMSGWDVATIPFALNDSTRFISPTKTPEYLAAGCPVVSTPIADVEARYAGSEVVQIAVSTTEFENAISKALEMGKRDRPFLEKVDDLLKGMSWDQTWRDMLTEIEKCNLKK